MVATVSVINRTTDPYDKSIVAAPFSESSTEPTSPTWAVVLIAGAFVAACVFVASEFLPHTTFPPATTPALVEGLTIFAVFFVGAQALERLLEPVALFLGIGDEERSAALTTMQAARMAAADPSIGEAEVAEAVKSAAGAKAKDARRTAEKTILFWGLATGLAALASGSFGFYLLSTVGIPVPYFWMEVLGTALIIGAGTKPLHDLITLIEKRKEAADQAAA
ncbi:hypothetical protein [Nakamurella sp.]|uniref:hypothetical protein n=1 Tax=Nakamurella sp. TaxID=1869182 RepID=UPI003B3B988B